MRPPALSSRSTAIANEAFVCPSGIGRIIKWRHSSYSADLYISALSRPDLLSPWPPSPRRRARSLFLSRRKAETDDDPSFLVCGVSFSRTPLDLAPQQQP